MSKFIPGGAFINSDQSVSQSIQDDSEAVPKSGVRREEKDERVKQ